jgi:hypothetical protein
VPLGDLGAFTEWAHRDNPPYLLGVAIRGWIERLSVSPWQYPSAPVPEMSVEGEYQVRTATLLGIEIFYREAYVDGKVDLLHVGKAPFA